LFAQNERVVYIGKKKSNSNFFSYTAVGATNEKKTETNTHPSHIKLLNSM